jgi:HSP20 family protein
MNEIAKKTEEKTPVVQPACDICEEDGKVKLSIDMPGVGKDGIEVSVEKNELVIVGRSDRKEAGGTYLIRERRRGEYRKRFIIDDTVDRERIEATVTNGVLKLVLNIKDAAKPRRIEIR